MESSQEVSPATLKEARKTLKGFRKNMLIDVIIGQIVEFEKQKVLNIHLVEELKKLKEPKND